MNKFELFTEGRKGILSNWNLCVVTGKDRESFFQGQTTNDILSMPYNTFNLNSRVDRTGKVQFFFINIKTENELFLLFPSDISEVAIAEFDKYIIMDEVTLAKDDRKLFFTISGVSEASDNMTGLLFGVPASISFTENQSSIKQLTKQEELELKIESGWPTWNEDVQSGDLINNTRLNDLAVSYTKGCFLGQETVAKVQNGRGASFYPSFLESDRVEELELGPFQINGRKGGEVICKSGRIAMVKLFREFRIENRSFDVIQNEKSLNLTFKNYPTSQSLEDFSHELYLYAVSCFQNEKVDIAISALQAVIQLTPAFSDAYESLGVIYGRQEKFELGIELMDKLLATDETSVMAHTNKSLYLMRLGKIEEAEEEKGLATVKSFAQFGKDAKEKKIKEEQEKEKENQINQREAMFKQVLEIDKDDTIANFGMADVYFYRKEYEKAKEHLMNVVTVDEKYSTAYTLLGKTLEILGEIEEAKKIYEKGIEVASAKGELMPANEMQARLVKL